MTGAVFFDRDGVLIQAEVRDAMPYSVQSLDEMRIFPGVEGAIKSLKDAGFKIIAATNQPDVATGKQEKSVVEVMNQRLMETLAIDAFKVCYHVDSDDCQCRKPKAGMLIEAASEWSIDLGRSFMVGDRWRDIDAGKAAGCKTLFIDYGYREPSPENPDFVVGSVVEASEIILGLGETDASSRRTQD